MRPADDMTGGARPAPCVAVVGPANSGKSTLLSLLDAALQGHLAEPLVHVVQGNPDGTGRYLMHAPELREVLRGRVKGSWRGATVATIREWIQNAREALELVLLDFGGRHSAANDAMLRRCSHYLAIARAGDAEGMASWCAVCDGNGLSPVARLWSATAAGRARPRRAAGGWLEGAFRVGGEGTARANEEVVARLVEALLALCGERRPAPYFDLRLGRDWTPRELPELGGLAERITALARRREAIVLGGRAPIWAYCAVLHRILDQHAEAAVAVFDPKVAGGRVVIPRRPRLGPGSPLAPELAVSWQREGEVGVLDLRITTVDCMLPRPALGLLPRPAGTVPAGDLVASGAVPIWLHLAYSRWLRTLGGQRALGVWDARRGGPVWVQGHRRAPA